MNANPTEAGSAVLFAGKCVPVVMDEGVDLMHPGKILLMTHKDAVRFILWLVLLLTGSHRLSAQSREMPNQPSARTLRQWGRETLTAITHDLWLARRKLYAEKATEGQAPPDFPAFMWGVGVQLTALAAAAQQEPKAYTPTLRTFADAIQVYWATEKGIGGYDVLPLPKPLDRYYDDNIWTLLALLETYEVTGDVKYHDRAEETFRFVLSGYDSKLGGGIYWKENERTSKNTCSNAPAIVAALRLYQITRKTTYLTEAYRIYDWTCRVLQDRDGLFWDNINLEHKIDPVKFSYNSALMIRANALFHAVTGQASYLTEAQRIARAAEAKWIVPTTGGVEDGGRFAHLLLESFLALYEQDKDPHWLAVVGKALTFLHEKVRDSRGRYPEHWDKPQATPLKEFALIDQASAARAYWKTAAVFSQKRVGP